MARAIVGAQVTGTSSALQTVKDVSRTAIVLSARYPEVMRLLLHAGVEKGARLDYFMEQLAPLRALMDLGIRSAVDVALLLNADEENGSDYGANYIVNNHADLFGKRDMFIVPDAGDPKATMVEMSSGSTFDVLIAVGVVVQFL